MNVLKVLFRRYWFCTLIALCLATVMALAVYWELYWLSVFSAVALLLNSWWQWKLYHDHTKRMFLMIDAMENSDPSFLFPTHAGDKETRQVNRALNRVGQVLHRVKNETAQQEKYYELILNSIGTGVVVLNQAGYVYQKNNEALHLLGLEVFTHVKQLSHIDEGLQERIDSCREGDRLQISFSNERGTVNLSIRVSGIVVRGEQLRILAFSDINRELDEKELESWVRLIRVLTHEIMKSVTPITSISDTLLSTPASDSDELHRGLKTISTTGRGLLAFVESYRRFTHIPKPEPSLFYVKAFAERMIELARHQNDCAHISFRLHVDPADLILFADENLISQVVINLLKNAIQAISAQTDGCITIRSCCNDDDEVIIEVRNNGPAIPSEVSDHIFVPFFTTKKSGSGIGLSLARQIMRLSGGSITLISGKETRFVLKFR